MSLLLRRPENLIGSRRCWRLAHCRHLLSCRNFDGWNHHGCRSLFRLFVSCLPLNLREFRQIWKVFARSNLVLCRRRDEELLSLSADRRSVASFLRSLPLLSAAVEPASQLLLLLLLILAGAILALWPLSGVPMATAAGLWGQYSIRPLALPPRLSPCLLAKNSSAD